MAILLAFVVAAPFTERPLAAQDSARVEERALSSLTGVVRDESGRPVEDADILLLQYRARATSRSDGTFRFEQIENGKYTLEVRRIGYKPATAKVSVKNGVGTATITLSRVPFSLPSVVTIADRGGLSGVVADTGYRPLSGVSVTVNGSGQRAETDSTGAFFLPIKAGNYLVVLRRSGYARQVVGVSVPPDTGRKIAAWMMPETHDSDPRYGAMLFDQNLRAVRATPATSKFYSREDIKRLGFTDLRAIGSYASGRLMNPDCPVMENGDPNRTLPLWAITAKELEFVEVYINPGVRNTPRPSGSGAASKLDEGRRAMSVVPSSSCGVSLVVWWRK